MKRMLLVGLCFLASVVLAGDNTDPAPAGRFCGSSKSNKYHLPSCTWAQKISSANKVWFKTKEEAKKMGYQPCGVCKPDSAVASPTESAPKTDKK